MKSRFDIELESGMLSFVKKRPKLPKDLLSEHQRLVEKQVEDIPPATLRTITQHKDMPIAKYTHEMFKEFVKLQHSDGAFFLNWFDAWASFVYFTEYSECAERNEVDH